MKHHPLIAVCRRSLPVLGALACLAVSSQQASAAACGGGFSYGNVYPGSPDISIEWGVCGDANDKLQLKVTANTLGWVAVGFSTGQEMSDGIDLFQGGVNAGSTYGKDRWASGHFAPADDVQQDYTIVSATESATATTLEIYRPLSTGDSNDIDLSTGSYYLLWSYRSTTATNRDNINNYHSGSRGASATPFQFAPVPLPAAVWLFSGALGLIGFLQRKA